MRLFRIILLPIVLFALCFAKPGLRFTEEDLSFEIADSIFSVQGIYYFDNDHAGKFSILYPFPLDDNFGKAYDIYVLDMKSGEEIPYKIKKDTSFVRFLLKVNGDTPVLISYKQRLHSNYARYILLSTHSWKQPLKRVEYKLKIPHELTISYFSIEPDNQIDLEGKVLYLWQREKYMPQSDLIFEFRKD